MILGIILSWRMVPGDRYAEVASYQLYAYTEIAGSTPSTAYWKKVGDVRALRLPMAVTLTQVSHLEKFKFFLISDSFNFILLNFAIDS